MLFVSYSTRDLAAVKRIVARLEARGLTCWYAARDIPPAAIFAKAIADAVARCDGFIAVISKASQTSNAVLRELELASNAAKTIYPLRLEAGALASGFDYYLSLAQWTEYGTTGDLALDRLADSLTGQAAAPRARFTLSGPRWRKTRRWGLGLVAVGGLAAAGYLLPSVLPKPAEAAPPITQQEARIALRVLDVDHINALLARGWNPNVSFDDQDNNALQTLLAVCEWNPGHDRQRLLLMARTLLEAQVNLTHRNTWGDTAFSIARAPRYCGPGHPVTVMLKTSCYNGFNPPGSQCEPRYRTISK